MRQRLSHIVLAILSLLIISVYAVDSIDVSSYGEVLCSQYDASTKTGYFSTRTDIYKIRFPDRSLTLIAQPTIPLGIPLDPGCYFDISNQVGYFFYRGFVGSTTPCVNILKVSLDNLTAPITTTVFTTYGLSNSFSSFWDDTNGFFYMNGATESPDNITFVNTLVRVAISDLQYVNQPLNGSFPISNGLESRVDIFVLGRNANGYLVAGALDFNSGKGIFASNGNPAQIFIANLPTSANSTSWNGTDITSMNVTLPGVSGVEGVVYDANRKTAYFYTVTTTQSAVVIKYDMTRNTYSTNQVISDQERDNFGAGVIDTQGGVAYFASLGNQGTSATVFKVALRTLKADKLELLDRDQTNARTGIIDTNDRVAYFSVKNSPQSTTTSFHIISVDLPLPCPTYDQVNPNVSCSGRGICDYGVCACNSNGFDFTTYKDSAGWGGPDCSYIGCPAYCFANLSRGVCLTPDRNVMGTCTCTDPNYTGNGCQTRQCPNACSSHGTCDFTTFNCSCDDLWAGPSCSTPFMPCESLTSCDTCRLNTSCGWCRSSKKCLPGDIDGPTNEGCLSWYYQECPDIGMEFWAFFFTAIAVLLMLVNMFSIFTEDKDATSQMSDNKIKASWWRNQRSAKFWVMIDQIQFAATCATFAVKSPSLFHNFVSVFRWSLIGFPLPWSTRTDADPITRNLLSMEQYTSSVTAYTDELLSGSLFWLAVLLLLVLVIFGIFFLINLCLGDKNFRDFVRNRVVYTLLRIALFAYLPFSIYSSYSLSYSEKSTTAAVLGVIVFIVYMVGFPVAIFFVLPRNKSQAKKIFEVNYLKKFGSVYNSFYYKRVWYMEVLLSKKLITGIIIGFLHAFERTQMIILIIIQILYLAQLIILKPYLDNLHTVLDAACTIADMIVIGLMFGFLSSVNASPRTKTILGALAAAVLILSQVMCVLAFIASWFKYRNIQTWRQLWERCRGKSRETVDVEDIELPVQKAD